MAISKGCELYDEKHFFKVLGMGRKENATVAQFED